MAVVAAFAQIAAPGGTVLRAEPGVKTANSTFENYPVLRFPSGSTTYYDLMGSLEGYGGAGFTVELPWTTDVAPTAGVTWGVGFRRLDDGHDLVDSPHGYGYQTVAATQPSAANFLTYASISFTNGQINGLLDQERFFMRVQRTNVGHTGDAVLLWPNIVIRD